MELQSALTPRVSAENALTASLFDECALDSATSPRDRFQSAFHASVIATTLEDELDLAMSTTKQLGSLGGPSGLLPSTTNRLELIATHPMANRRDAPIKPLSNLTERQTSCY